MPQFSLLLYYQSMKYIILFSPPQISDIWRWRQSDAQSHVAGGDADRSGELKRVKGKVGALWNKLLSHFFHSHFSLFPLNLFLCDRIKNVLIQDVIDTYFFKKERFYVSLSLFLSAASLSSLSKVNVIGGEMCWRRMFWNTTENWGSQETNV